MKKIILLLSAGLVLQNSYAAEKLSCANPVAEINTNMGIIDVELNPKKAPITVKNFETYVNSGFYNGKIFHRVIDGFMIQGGGFDKNMVEAKTNVPIKNEATNGLANDKYTIAMARTSVVDSATAQFFINTNNNSFLNHTSNSPQGYGYAVFGRVIKGSDVVDKISKTKTGIVNGYQDVPLTNVVINNIKMLPCNKK